MGKIYTLVNQKGGVGKTTTAINLGAYLAKMDQRVLLVDLDPQSNATSCLGIDKNAVDGGTYDCIIDAGNPSSFILHNARLKISILPSSPSLAGAEVELVSQPNRESQLKGSLGAIADRYDYILIDCPPSLGLLTLNGLVAARDGLIIPVQCEYLALEGISLLMTTIQKIRTTIYPELQLRGVLPTMFDGRTRLANDVVAEVRKYFPNIVFQAVIPRTVRLAEAPSYGQPISLYSPESAGATAYENLAQEILTGDGVLTPEQVF